MTKDTDIKRIQELVELLSRASRAYYAEDREIMSNLEYDRLYDELTALEEKTGVVLANSPTVQVGYASVDYLPKEAHGQPMLSLDKTKDVEALRDFIGEQKTLLSWKLDGLTIVLTYENGELQRAVTRGNGVIGEVVTNNARTFVNLPLHIAHRGEVVLRGEAIITYSDFEKINRDIGDAGEKYKNPRNLCSGSVRQLNSAVTAERHVRFYAFSLVRAEGVDFKNSNEEKFRWLAAQGFDVVEYRAVTAHTLDAAITDFSDQVTRNDFPSDGLVALYDDIAYGESLGNTAKFPRNAMAFKWADEQRETHLLSIEWSPSRTGLLNPVAIFEPVELEGTTVSRASVHNLSILKELELGIGDEIVVYKANMIIPQISANNTRSGVLPIPEHCPACGGPVRIVAEIGAETLHCENPDCPAKAMKAYTLFVSRDALNIDGLSEASLEKLMAHGLIHGYEDLFRLQEHEDVIVGMDGFGQKSYENLVKNAAAASHTTLTRLLYGLGIRGIGLANAKALCRAYGDDLDALRQAGEEELAQLEGIGPVLAKNFSNWWQDPKNSDQVDRLLAYLTIEKENDGEGEAQTVAGKTFVITGSLQHFSSRRQLQELIERRGGKVAGSVSAKTDVLINNDVTSTSSKNKKAMELGIPILSEEEAIRMIGEL